MLGIASIAEISIAGFRQPLIGVVIAPVQQPAGRGSYKQARDYWESRAKETIDDLVKSFDEKEKPEARTLPPIERKDALEFVVRESLPVGNPISLLLNKAARFGASSQAMLDALISLQSRQVAQEALLLERAIIMAQREELEAVEIFFVEMMN